MSRLSSDQLHALHAQAWAADVPWVGENVTVDYVSGQHRLYAPARAKDRIDQIPNTRKRGDYWTIPGREEHVPLIDAVFSGHVTWTEEATLRLRRPVRLEWESPVPVITYEEQSAYQERGELYLLEHQAEDVRSVLAGGVNGIFAHDMGLGKTIMAIHWARAVFAPERNRMLVISTRAMTHTWAEEVQKHWPGAKTFIADGDMKAKRAAVDGVMSVIAEPAFLITTYDAARTLTSLKSWGGKRRTEKQREPKYLQKVGAYFGATIIDEAHRISNPKNATSMAVGAIGDMSHHRLAMSGTIMRKASDDLWGVLHWVDPELWGSRSWYRNRYADMQMEWHGRMVNMGFKEANLQELTDLMEPTYLRRHKTEVPGIPGRLPTRYVHVPLTAKQATQYVDMEQQMIALTEEEGMLVAENAIVRDLYLRVIACGLVEVDEHGKISTIATPSNKLEAVLDHITELAGAQTVIGVDSRQYADFLSRQLSRHKIKHGMMVGGRKTFELQADKRSFQAGDLQVMIVQYGVGSEGLTLTSASDVLLVQENWNWTETDQLISRVDRLGQTEPVRVTVLHSEGTIDHWVREVNIRKLTLAEIINRDGLDMEDMTRGGILNRSLGERT